MSILYASWIFRSDMYTLLCQVVNIDTDLIYATYIILYKGSTNIHFIFPNTSLKSEVYDLEFVSPSWG